MAKKNKRLKLEVDIPDEEADQVEEAPARRPSRLRWLASRLFVLMILLAGLVVAAPSIVSATGLWKSVLKWADPELASKIEIGSLSLAWWSPVGADKIVVRDPAGEVLAEVASVRTQKTLFALASNYQDLGQIEITEPRAKVVLRTDGTNVEDFLADLPKADEHAASPPISFIVVVKSGQVELDDRVAGRAWSLADVHVDLAWPAAADQPKTGKLSAALKPAAGSPPASSNLGEILADFLWQPGAGEQLTLGTGEAKFKLTGLATEVAEGGLRRYVADIRPAGALTVDAAYQWAEDGKSQHILLRQLAAPQLTVAAPAYLHNDQITAQISTGQADVILAGGRLDLKQLKLISNLVELSGQGSAALSSLSSGQLLNTSGTVAENRTRAELTGQIHLAELARQLPTTLHMKEGTTLTEGAVQLSLVSQDLADGSRWQGWLKTDKLQGLAAGRPIAFNQPLEIDFTVGQTAAGPTIDRLSGSSSFFRLEGSGMLSKGSITASADLNQLAAELRQFIDLGETKLAGTLAAQIGWNQGRTERDPWTAQADVRVQNFELAAAGLAPWRESDLNVAANLRGELQSTTLTRIDSGELTISAAGDRLEAKLTEPVQSPSATSSWPVAVTLVGDLATWMPRLQPVVPLGGWQVAGTINAQAAGWFSPADCQLGPTKINLENLAADGPSLSIREPVLKIDTAGTWTGQTQTLVLPSTTLASTSLAFRADEIRVIAGKEPAVTGVVEFRGDVHKLSSWIGAAGAPRTWQMQGQSTGRVEIGYRGQALEAKWLADVENLRYFTLDPPPQTAAATTLATASAGEPQWIARWVEPKVSLSGQAGYDPAASRLSLARASLNASLASVTAAGTISELTTRCLADLQGEVAYDLDAIERKLKDELFARGPSDDPKKLRAIDTLDLAGQEKRPFSLKGPLLAAALTPSSSAPQPATSTPLVSQDLTGEASLGWQGAQFVGLIAGPAEFRAKLSEGIVNIGPLDIPVSEGRLTTAPRLVLVGTEPVAYVERGPLIQSVRISPEMCNLWLKYVAPLVADATEAEGKFSLNLEGASVPLLLPKRANVSGTLAIHGAQVGPGPLAKQYLGMIRQFRTWINPQAATTGTDDNYGRWLLMPEHNVQFAVKDGVVYHDGLTMTAREFVIYTKGSVNIETQELNLVASIPIQEKWFENREKPGLLSTLKGQTIQIPIQGTLGEPKPDGKILEGLGKQLAGQALNGVIDKGKEKLQGIFDKELGRGLERLFGPRTPAAPNTPLPAGER